MNAIVMNTLTGAVTEYSNFDFQSLTPAYGGSVNGLFSFGGDLDLAQPVVARVVTGKTQWEQSLKLRLRMMFFALKGTGSSTAIVKTDSAEWTYTLPVQDNGESRAQPGRGIRENYLAFGYTNTDGADFQLDRIEVVDNRSTSRRT